MTVCRDFAVGDQVRIVSGTHLDRIGVVRKAIDSDGDLRVQLSGCTSSTFVRAERCQLITPAFGSAASDHSPALVVLATQIEGLSYKDMLALVVAYNTAPNNLPAAERFLATAAALRA